MKTREEMIAEVLRLDEKRTQGNWSSGFNGTCFQVDAEMDAVCTTQFCYADESKQNAQFISRAPDMARIIRDFQKREALLVEALRFYSDVSDYIAPLTGGMGKLYFDCGDKAKATLTRIKSGEWME